jgi:glycosyltransferase involved in cell wall biosynthesis
MKISIVVPTRNRAEFLKYCLETCLASSDPNIEVVISDNNSVDDTRDVVGIIQDPRLVYVHPGRDLSMRQNFEFALSHATGDYVIFIGDDDGVVPNGIATLRYMIDKWQPDIITWRHITYIWPHMEPVPTDGILKFRYRDFCGPLYRPDPKQVFQDFCDAKLTNYRDGANIYHGCISRSIIEKIKANGGEYFQGQIPDVNTALSNLTVADTWLWIRNPVTIAGAGEKSNGTAMNAPKKATEKQTKIAENFTELAEADKIQPEIDLRIRSIPAYVYANLMRINHDHLNSVYKIDHARWREVVINDMHKFPKQNRCWDVLEEFFTQMDSHYKPIGLSDPVDEDDRDEISAVSQPARKKRKSMLTEADLQNVATVVDWLQKVTGKAYFPTENSFLAYMKQFWKSFEMRSNVKSLESSRRK